MFKQSNDDIHPHRPLYTRLVNSEGLSCPMTRPTWFDMDIMRVKLHDKTGHLENFHHFILYNYRTPPDQFLVTQSKYCEIKYCSSYKKLQSKFTANYESSVTYITTIKRKQDTKIYIEYLTWKVWRNITVQRYSLQTILIKVNQSTDTEAHPD